MSVKNSGLQKNRSCSLIAKRSFAGQMFLGCTCYLKTVIGCTVPLQKWLTITVLINRTGAIVKGKKIGVKKSNAFMLPDRQQHVYVGSR